MSSSTVTAVPGERCSSAAVDELESGSCSTVVHLLEVSIGLLHVAALQLSSELLTKKSARVFCILCVGLLFILLACFRMCS